MHMVKVMIKRPYKQLHITLTMSHNVVYLQNTGNRQNARAV